MQPDEARYMNGLGVSLLRSKNYEEAEICFSRALSLPLPEQEEGGRYDAAEENLREVRLVLVALAEDSSNGVGQQKHVLRCPIQLSAQQLFNVSSVTGSMLTRPFVVRGLAGMGDAGGSLLRRLSETLGEQRVDYYPYSMRHSKVSPFFLSLQEGLELLTNTSKLSFKSARFATRNAVEALQMRRNVTGQYVQWNLGAGNWRAVLAEAGFAVPPSLDDRCDYSVIPTAVVLPVICSPLVAGGCGGAWDKRLQVTSLGRLTGRWRS